MAVLVIESAEQALIFVRELASRVRQLSGDLEAAKDRLAALERDEKKTRDQLQNAKIELLKLASQPASPSAEVDDLSSTEDPEAFADVDQDPREVIAVPSASYASPDDRPDFGTWGARP